MSANILDTILNYSTTYSQVLENSNISNKKELILKNENDMMNILNISDKQQIKAWSYKETLEINMCTALLKDVLSNSPYTDIFMTEFTNIKTKLYPYQINNLNWMINIEKRNYVDEYKDLSNKIIFKGGGLFDEVGMGKTLQIITLINIHKSEYKSLIKEDKLFSKATIIIVPNHLCGQWEREIDLHTNKKLKVIHLLTKHHYKKYSYYDLVNTDIVIVSSNFFINCKLNQHQKSNQLYNIKNVFNKDVNIFHIHWYRVVIDEYHEMEDSLLFSRLKYLQSNYRWIISGTPFKQEEVHNSKDMMDTSFSIITDYLTNDINVLGKNNIYDYTTYQYIKSHFSRNMHKNNIAILKLPNIIEETVWLDFTDTERMIYNAYIADANNSPYDVFLRQICCHPKLSDKLRDNMHNINTLDDMKEYIHKMYLHDYDKANNHYTECQERIEKYKKELEELEEEKKTDLQKYINLKEDIKNAEEKLEELQKTRDGKKQSLEYYINFRDLLNDMDKIKEQECAICLDTIKEHDIGVTICSHMFCYSCIRAIVKENNPKCPYCEKVISLDKIFLMSNKKSEETNTLGTKLGYLIKYIKSTPEKYRIIFSQWENLLREVGQVLEENNIKQLFCHGNVYQKDKVLKLFNNVDQNNDNRIIMLSSESAVSGSNLNNAEEVIFLDPIYGDKQFRQNTENQAIGRVRRLGNKHENIKVIRLLIRDSVEQEITENNIN